MIISVPGEVRRFFVPWFACTPLSALAISAAVNNWNGTGAALPCPAAVEARIIVSAKGETAAAAIGAVSRKLRRVGLLAMPESEPQSYHLAQQIQPHPHLAT